AAGEDADMVFETDPGEQPAEDGGGETPETASDAQRPEGPALSEGRGDTAGEDAAEDDPGPLAQADTPEDVR
ncbi:MAG: hypothetical protein AAF447_22895, partial [Myxococcota bacterium]